MIEILAMIGSIDAVTLATVAFYAIVPFVLFFAKLRVHAFFALMLFFVFLSAKIDYHYYQIGDVAWKWFVFNVGTGVLMLSMALALKKYSNLTK